MKHVIIGTAGHVDHGKTTLIKALTGIDADRLKEEKERGLTIDIGFAYFDLPSGRRAGIIDVPGHERFLKNMLAGIAGIDIVLLVIAADEGIMPQTREHLAILSTLEVKRGIVVLTKADMVDEEWLELMIEEVKDHLEGTFLESAPLIPVAALQGMGLDALAQAIDEVTLSVEGKNIDKPFRLPVDRVFSVKGFGTVVTGTLVEGRMSLDDQAQLQPSGLLTRVRNIQIHGKSSPVAQAGQRVALNLANINVDQCQRGDVLAAPGLLEATMMLDVSLHIVDDASRMLKHWDRVRVYTGTSEVLGRAVLLDREELWPGEQALIQLRLEAPIVALRDDRYVLRSYSPLATLGGGKIIDAQPIKKKRFRSHVIDGLQLRATGSDEAIVRVTLEEKAGQFLSREETIKASGLPLEQGQDALENLANNEEVVFITLDHTTFVLLSQQLDDLSAGLSKFLADYHKRYPLRLGVSKAEARQRFASRAAPKLFNQVLLIIKGEGQIELQGEHVKLVEHQISFSGPWGRLRQQILDALSQTAFAPPDVRQLALDLQASRENVEEVLTAMSAKGELVKINNDFFLIADDYHLAQERLKAYLVEHDTINLAAFRDALQTSRKYAVPLLEHFDQIRLTRRVGDDRVLYKRV